MRRRDLVIGLIATATASGTLHAQKIARVAILSGFTDDSQERLRIGLFKATLQEFGWIEGRNLQIDYRKSGPDALERVAREIIDSRPNAILAMPTPALAALAKMDKSIPTVFVNVSDPVQGGFVQSLSRPGGNTTGFTAFEYSIGGKWIETLKEISPSITRVLVLLFEANYTSRGLLHAIQKEERR